MRRDFPDFPHFLKLFRSAFSPGLHFRYSLGLPYFFKLNLIYYYYYLRWGRGGAFHEQRLVIEPNFPCSGKRICLSTNQWYSPSVAYRLGPCSTIRIDQKFFSLFSSYRFLPSTRVSHSISVHDILDADRTARQASRVSPPTFMCGTAKPKRRMRTCPSQEKSYSERHLERFHTEQSISHHRSSLNIISRHPERHVSRAYSSLDTCTLRVPLLTLRDVVETKSACLCRGQRFIGTGLHRERQGNLEFIEVRMQVFETRDIER